MAEEYIEVDQNHRLGWGYDESPENPRDDETPVGFVTIEHRSRYIDVKEVHSDPTGRLAEAHEHFDSAGYPKWEPAKGYQRRKPYYPNAEDTTERWARIFHGVHIEYDSEYQGYWFIDPDALKEGWTVAEDGTVPVWEQRRYEDGSYASEVIETGRQPVEALAHEMIEAERKEYSAWAQGYVFYVFGQKRLLTHTEVTLPDGTKVREVDGEDWETEDSISGIYSDDFDGWLTEDEVYNVAKDYFGEEYAKKKVAH